MNKNQKYLNQGNQQDCKKIGKHIVFMDKVLGSGHQGKVYLAYEQSSQEECGYRTDKSLACKLIEREKLSAKA